MAVSDQTVLVCSNYVLEKTSGIDEPGSLKWDLTLCNLGAWVIICISLIKGVSSMGKVRHSFIYIYISPGFLLSDRYTSLYIFLYSPDSSSVTDTRVCT